MNLKKYLFVPCTFLCVMSLTGCSKTKTADAPVDMHTTRISVDWTGMYTGVIPGADNPGINVGLLLKDDNTYELTYRYGGHDDAVYKDTGAFSWNDDGSTIKLDIADAPPYYFVAENQVTQLDMEGNLITGSLAENYVLKKTVGE